MGQFAEPPWTFDLAANNPILAENFCPPTREYVVMILSEKIQHDALGKTGKNEWRRDL